MVNCMAFIGRKSELEFLNSAYKRGGFQFVPIYGRRRIGKTELILQFIKDKKAIYFVATSGTKNENIERFKVAAKEIIDLSFIRNEWEDIFEYMAKNIKEEVILAIDEFPYLVDSERGLSSIFQKSVDEYLKSSNIFLILCGSSLSMMWKEVLAYKAPLYGRRTGQIELKPFRFPEVMEFTGKGIEDSLRIYSVCGGVPAYLKEFQSNKGLFDNIKEKILARGSVLNEEALFLMRQEFREPKVYMSILSALSLGMNSLGKIISFCGFRDKAGIVPYLHNLESLHYIKRELPVTESLRSKKGNYVITDNYFSFWFRFVRPNESLADENPNDAIKLIKKDFDLYVSKIFENVCRSELISIIPSRFSAIGRWWGKTPDGVEEIDIVAFNGETKDILFAECKWKNKEMKIKDFFSLVAKADHVEWNKGKRTESFALFSRNGFDKKLIEYARENRILLYTIRDIDAHFAGRL